MNCLHCLEPIDNPRRNQRYHDACREISEAERRRVANARYRARKSGRMLPMPVRAPHLGQIEIVRDPQDDFPRGSLLDAGALRRMLRDGYLNPGTQVRTHDALCVVTGEMFSRQELVEC